VKTHRDGSNKIIKIGFILFLTPDPKDYKRSPPTTGFHSVRVPSKTDLVAFIWIIQSMRKRWARHVAHMGQTRNAYRILDGKAER